MVRKYGIVLLAAGSSSRLGTPKQLLRFKNMSLLQLAVTVSAQSNASEIIVVLGSGADLLKKELEGTKARMIINADWNEGMAGSLVLGLKELIARDALIEGVIFMMCDQPFITAELLNNLIETQLKTGKKIVTSRFNGTTGPPALFEKTLFPELMKLKGDAGARKIVQENADETVTVLFPDGNFDIDTAEDYENLLHKQLN